MNDHREYAVIDVRTLQDWEQVLQHLDGFHDAVIKQAWFLEETYVTEAQEMHFGSGMGPVLNVLVQSQSGEQPAAELVFRGVTRFTFERELEIEPGVATCRDNSWRFEFLAATIDASECKVFLLDESFLGPGPFAVPPGLSVFNPDAS